MTNHTPAPWHRNIKPASKYAVIFSGRNTHVAQVISRGLTEEEIEANCDLIAAAPELLAAAEALLEDIYKEFDTACQYNKEKLESSPSKEDLQSLDVFKNMEKAINKAKGEQ